MNPDALSEEVLSAYVDGECTDDERIAVEARLASDAEWREILEEIRDDARARPRAAAPRTARGVRRRTRRRARGRGGRRVRGERTAASPRRPHVIAGIAAAAAIAVGFMIASPAGRSSDVAPPIATLANSHGATMSLQSDPLSGLAPIAANSGIEP